MSNPTMCIKHTLTHAAGFAVANIRKVNWNPESFSRLAIRPDKKEVLKGVAISYTNGRSGSNLDDFIQGKGRGLIALLQLVLLLSSDFRF